MSENKHVKKAEQFFKKELDEIEVQKSVHYTYKDGFRLGFGFFVGFALALLIVFLVFFVTISIISLF